MAGNRLIIVTGPSAAGKTTVGHQLAARLARAVHIDGDVIQRFVVSGAVEMDVPPPPGAVEQLELRYAAAGRDRVDRDAPRPELFGRGHRHPFHRGL